LKKTGNQGKLGSSLRGDGKKKKGVLSSSGRKGVSRNGPKERVYYERDRVIPQRKRIGDNLYGRGARGGKGGVLGARLPYSSSLEKEGKEPAEIASLMLGEEKIIQVFGVSADTF